MWRKIYSLDASPQLMGRRMREYNPYLEALKTATNKEGKVDLDKISKSEVLDELKSGGIMDSIVGLSHYKLNTVAHLNKVPQAYGLFFVESVQLSECIEKWNKLVERGIVKRIDYQTESGNKGEHCVRLYVENYYTYESATNSFDYECAMNVVKFFDREQGIEGITYYLKPVIGTMFGIISKDTFGLPKPYLIKYGGD